jgi:hypothetical protein
MSWTWPLRDSAGEPTAAGAPILTANGAAGSEATTTIAFDSQGDAESFIGEVWRELLAAGVESVTLNDGAKDLYTMSLQPPEL